MKLATLRDGTRDGKLIVVRRDGAVYAEAKGIAPTLQAALDDWEHAEPQLRALAEKLEKGEVAGTPVEVEKLHSPLPRAYEWVDGSAYINHVILVRKARGAEPPETLRTDPLVYQGGSGTFLAPTEDIPLADPDWGCDFESEICVVLGDTPQGTKASEAGQHVRLLMLCNDVTLRNLIPAELAKGFGFFQGKPSSAFSPFAITPDELGDAWRGNKLHLPLVTHVNGEWFGAPEAGVDMQFDFAQLVAHAAKTRPLSAGTIVGSGTIANEDTSKGASCFAEKRTVEALEHGKPITPFLSFGDSVRIEMLDAEGKSIFGAIEQRIERYDGP